MKVRVTNISERELRLYLQGCVDVDHDYNVVIDVVNEFYGGRLVNLIYRLLIGETGMFRILSDRAYHKLSYKNQLKVRSFLPIKQLLDNDHHTKKCCFYVEHINIEQPMDVVVMSEIEYFLDKVSDDRMLMSIYWLLLRLLDVFIGDLLEFERDDHGEWEENIEIIYVRNKFNNLELVLF